MGTSPRRPPAARVAVFAACALALGAAAWAFVSCTRGEAPSAAAPAPPSAFAIAAPRAGDAAGAAEASTPVPVRFAAIGDTGRGTSAQIKVAQALAAKCARDGCDFVLFLGDNVYPSGLESADDPRMRALVDDVYGAEGPEIFAVLGNHDYGGNGSGLELHKGRYQIDYTDRSKRWRMPGAWYRATRGPVELFALDSTMQLFGRDEAQRRDVSAWIAASTARWKIAVAHHPYRSNGLHGNAGAYDGIPIPPSSGKGVRDFDDAVICGKVDLLLSGHDHSRQWLTDTCRGTELVVSGTGAEGTELPGHEPTHYQSIGLGFVYFVIDGGRLNAEFVDDEAQTEYTHTLTKT